MSEASSLQLPRGWSKATLADLTEPRGEKANPQATPEKRFIGMEHVEAHTMRLLGTVPCSSMRSGANVFFPSDILYGRLRSYLNKVYQPDFPGLCSGEFIVLSESRAVLGRFLKYRLNAGDFVAFASHLNSGDRPRVDFDQIKAFATPLPPRPEQERIADALDELLSDLDAAVAALVRVRGKLKLYRAAVLKAAVEGALTAEWREQHPDTEPASELLQHILAERRRRWEAEQLARFEAKGQEPPKNWKAKYKEPIARDTRDLPPLPGGWCWATLRHVLWGLRSGNAETSRREPTDYPVLKSSAVRNGVIDFEDVNYLQAAQSSRPENFLQRGDFLITRLSGSIEYVGRTAVVKGSGREKIQYPDRIFSGKLIPGAAGEYVSYCFQHPRTRRPLEAAAKSTAGHQRVSMSDLQPLVLAIPPFAEQEAIIEAVEDQLSVIDHLEADIEAKVKSAQSLRQAILRHAFSGKLVPQDPNDEPATELLKRIAAERGTRAREAAAKRAGRPAATRRRVSRRA